ncbi:hypothetical protein BCR32DRAFT_280709 [Anaeromyces robustus]|uniref:Uncharacterized protein n=1 Tax=Anaeromyces robustus TaxID=1754192 RepID=A0A1Y1X351_9FUNG|nr:hypothetical protein BCR32DRAFT_280709 [Anaeromyces robustus]|eukprot:ORX80240.1 hypothetical protein BCR32DRAFT_280709 [Anaeromyces robustus]
MNNFENLRNYLKLNFEFLEYSKGFIVAKAAKLVNISCPNGCSCLFHNNLFNSLFVTSDNSSVDNRIYNIVKGYKSSSNNM